jgi:hypothetical protein
MLEDALEFETVVGGGVENVRDIEGCFEHENAEGCFELEFDVECCC